jgi:hypothetical protein
MSMKAKRSVEAKLYALNKGEWSASSFTVREDTN